MKVHIILVSLVLLLVGRPEGAAQDLRTLTLKTRVTDLTGTLRSQDVAELESTLRQFETQTSTQVVVVMIRSLGEEPIEEAAYEIARTNGIGQKGKDNGILVLIAKEDKQVRIEVGYGLEGVLPDILAGQIIRREMAPFFREGNYAAGIRAGIDAIIRATRNEYTADKSQRQSPRGSSPLLLILLFLFFVFSRMRRRRTPMIGPWFGGWGGGGFGGSGGFGGGGFSGGGGSFGGGGASGRW
jgi:uncharacterized protein